MWGRIMKWWWLNWIPVDYSNEERRASIRLGLTMLCVFIVLAIALSVVNIRILRWLAIRDLFPATIGVFIAIFLATWVARPICAHIWPDVIKKGDEKAAIRIGNRNRSQ
jgi:hypothetical protein